MSTMNASSHRSVLRFKRSDVDASSGRFELAAAGRSVVTVESFRRRDGTRLVARENARGSDDENGATVMRVIRRARSLASGFAGRRGVDTVQPKV